MGAPLAPVLAPVLYYVGYGLIASPVKFQNSEDVTNALNTMFAHFPVKPQIVLSQLLISEDHYWLLDDLHPRYL
jgi:hypothetical protein